MTMKFEMMPGSTRFIAGCLVMAVLVCGSCKSEKNNGPRTKPAVPVTVTQAMEKEVPVQLKAIGTVEAFATVALKSQISGQIARVHFEEGSEVEKGDLLISIDPEPFLATLGQYKADLARNQAQEKYAREQAARYEGLVKEGIVAQDQYDLLRPNAESLAAAMASDRAAIRSAEIQLSYCSIRSPISGRTGTLDLHPGNLVKANDLPIVTIHQICPINVVFSIPEKRLAEVKTAMAEGELKIEAMIPDEPGHTETGTLSFMDNAVNSETGTIKIKGVFANAAKKLWPGRFIDVVMTLASLKNAVTVPANAVQTGQQGQFVYIVKPDKTVEVRPVTVGPSMEEEIVIESGLASGETIVVDGQLRLVPGAAIEAKNPSGQGEEKP
jgi:multidrug efflux system membrane fusion protein